MEFTEWLSKQLILNDKYNADSDYYDSFYITGKDLQDAYDAGKDS